MKREIEIAVERSVLELPGIAATKTALIVFDSASDEQLTQAFSQIAKMDRSIAWWIGDLGIALQDRKRRTLAKEAAALRARAGSCSGDDDGVAARRRLEEQAERIENLGVIEYTRELCTAFSISESYVKGCVAWARFYEPSNRLDGLTPKHHQVAMMAAGGAGGNAAAALIWLASAKEKGLTASELRKEVNVARGISEPPEVEIERLTYEEVAAADAWAVRFLPKVENMKYPELVRLFTQMHALLDLGAKLLAAIKEKAPADLEEAV